MNIPNTLGKCYNCDQPLGNSSFYCSSVCEEVYWGKNERPKRIHSLEFMQSKLKKWAQEERDKGCWANQKA